MSSLFVNSLEDEDYDVGECHYVLVMWMSLLLPNKNSIVQFCPIREKVPCNVSGLYNLCVYGPTI